jgi:hypothetical protein
MSTPRFRFASRVRGLAALALLLPALGGCVYFAGATLLGAGIGAASAPRPLPSSSPYPPGAALLVDFAPGRDVAVLVPGDRDSLRVSGVTRIVGTLRSSRSDTLFVAITEMRQAGGRPYGFAARYSPMLALPPGTPARIQLIARNSAAGQRAVVGGLLGFGLSIALIMAACAGGCMN